MHGILACAGTAGSGQSCAAGAAGAAASSLLTNLFTDQPGETNAQKEAKRNLITSLVAGVAGIASSTNASTATNAATIAVDNNYLTQQQKQARAEALSGCKTPDCQKDIRARYAKLYEKNRSRVVNCSTEAECLGIAKELREEQSAQGKRAAELIDKAKFGNGLSDAEQMELADLRLADTSINQMRSYAVSNAARAGGAAPLGDTEQQLLAGDIGISAAAGIGAVQKVGSKHNDGHGAPNAVLFEEMAAKGIKFTPDNVIQVSKLPDGKIIFLESGNSTAGLQHILDRHALDFTNKGIPTTEIPSVVMKAVTEGKMIGTNGSAPVYEIVHNGVTQHISVGVASNGFIVRANPVSTWKPL